jgi:anthranilate phosphoribosyltransferase
LSSKGRGAEALRPFLFQEGPAEKKKGRKRIMRDYILKVMRGEDLSEDEMKGAMQLMISGAATPAQAGAFLAALRFKGETVEEILGAVKAIKQGGPFMSLNGKSISLDRDEINLEAETIMSTALGNNGSTKTFNVSTATAFVTAGAGLKTVRYGTRAASRLCGSADVLEQLGIKTAINAAEVQRCIEDVGVGFFYPPLTQGPMGRLAGIRQEIGIRTILNLAGPICNPAGASAQMVGVYKPELTEKLAAVLQGLGVRNALVVHGEGTMDEISICGRSTISMILEGNPTAFTITPEDLGFKRASLEEVEGGNAGKNASLVREVLEGRKGARRDMVLMNAGACFVLMGLAPDMSQGVKRAAETIDSGAALEKLRQAASFTAASAPYVRKEII